MEVSGKIKVILDKQTFNSGFTKQEMVITTQEQYPQHISIEFLQDKISLLENLQVGDDVKVSINLRGREWTNPEGITKYFNSITGWRVEKINQESDLNEYNNLPPTPPVSESSYKETLVEDDDDDLPF